jgi:large subunit ribosomal protein L3
MEKAILGIKLGMSQIFTPSGKVIPVTVIQAGPCSVVQVKTKDVDGYDAVKVGFGDAKDNEVNKPDAGQFKKAGVAPKKHLKEFRLSDCSQFKVGGEFKCDVFKKGDMVDVSGLTRGRGFTGVVQRWNYGRNAMSHGAGPVHRHLGSIGANASPGKVFKNKKMAGQYGHERVTMQNLEIVKIDADKNLILVAGGVPGPSKGIVEIKTTVKEGKVV